MKKLIIHIGTGKTGTSTIQNFLYANRKQLIQHFSLFYPDYGLTKSDHFGELICAHYPVVTWIAERQTEQLTQLAQFLENSGCAVSVISCENFYHHLRAEDIKYLGKVLNNFAIEIICYVRRQDLYMESAWKQQVKIGALSIPFPDFLAMHTSSEMLEKVQANYFRILTPWVTVFGVPALKIRVFDKSEWKHENLIDDFLFSCGIDCDKAHQVMESWLTKTNTAFPSELLLLVRKTNALKLIPKKEQKRFVCFLDNLNIFNETSLLSPAERKQVLANYQQSNLNLFAEYCGRSVPECFLAASIEATANESNSQSVLLEDIAVRTIAAIWQQATPAKALWVMQEIKLIKKYMLMFTSWLFQQFVVVRNKVTAQGYKPSAVDPSKKQQPAQFFRFSGKPLSIPPEECEYFFYYGFTQLSNLKTKPVSALHRRSITVGDCFISAARRGSQIESRRLLQGALYENGQIIRAASHRGPGQLQGDNPDYVNQNRINKSRYITGTCVYMGWLINSFGHLLLEAPARFWILNSIDIVNTRFIFHPLNFRKTYSGLVPTRSIVQDSFILKLIECYGISCDQIILADHDLCVEQLIIPTSSIFINHTIDARQMFIYNKIRASILQAEKLDQISKPNLRGKKKIYLSRRLLKNPGHNRKAKNEEEIEDLFVAFGFEIIFPEQLPFQEQVQLISRAENLAGCEGSALHMGVFLRPTSKMIVLTTRHIVTNQLIVNSLRKVETHIIYAGTDRTALRTVGRWEADIPFIKENLEKIIK